uniref:Uncharacterized protein n=1 Tax=Oryza sativa subsp. japonica TaxID=39947 RepID=Q69NP8_ORYSJ|nr:hypothetical protein [Oryza sativa Japonica Group]BAD36186.1 hypothetical protein [Oryza sativa Japonica Group]
MEYVRIAGTSSCTLHGGMGSGWMDGWMETGRETYATEERRDRWGAARDGVRPPGRWIIRSVTRRDELWTTETARDGRRAGTREGTGADTVARGWPCV